MNKISLYVGVEIYTSWSRVSIGKRLDALCNAFNFNGVDISLSKSRLTPGKQVKIMMGSDLIMVGYIDRLDASFSKDHSDVTIAGRDLCGDLVDSSVNEKSDEFLNQSLYNLTASLCRPYGILVKDETDDQLRFTVWKVDPGETVFDTLERAARQRGTILKSDGLGSLILSKIGQKRAEEKLIEGENIIEASISYDHSSRYRHYIVKGQSYNDDVSFEVEARCQESEIDRERQLVVLAEGSIDKPSAQKRAYFEKSVRKAKAISIFVTVYGWRQRSGRIWQVGELVTLRSERLGIDGDLLIVGVDHSFDQDGTVTRLEMSHPGAYQSETGVLV